MEADSAIFSATLPSSSQSFEAWTAYGVRGISTALSPAATLAPLLANLPPLGPHRKPLPLRPLRPEALHAFELQAVDVAPAGGAGADATASQRHQQQPPPPRDPRDKDVRWHIWKDAHVVHDKLSSQWPHTWPRPPFANDAANPTKDEWMPYAKRLAAASGWQTTLARWRDAPEQAPQTRAAAKSLLEALGKFVVRVRELEEKQKAEALVKEARGEYEGAMAEMTNFSEQALAGITKCLKEQQARTSVVLRDKRSGAVKRKAAEDELAEANVQYARDYAEIQATYTTGVQKAVSSLWAKCPAVAQELGLPQPLAGGVGGAFCCGGSAAPGAGASSASGMTFEQSAGVAADASMGPSAAAPPTKKARRR